MIIQKKEHSKQPENETPHERLIEDICSTDPKVLDKKLEDNMKWDKPTGDLVHWSKVLNMFDDIFEKQITNYGLDEPYPKLREILPDDSKLLVACLKFTSMLLDHCSNGTIYSSSERIFQLIETPSIEVRIAAMEVAIFLGERHSNSNSKRFSFPKSIRSKMVEIAKSYPPPLPSGFIQKKIEQSVLSADDPAKKTVQYSLVDSIDLEKKYPSKWKLLSFQYYDPNSTEMKSAKDKKGSQPKVEEGVANFSLNEDQVRRLSYEQILDKGSECLPKESWFTFSLAALNVKAFNTKLYDSLKARYDLVRMKCIAVAITCLVCNTDYTSSNLFEPEPYILSFLVDLVSPEFCSVVPTEVSHSAIKALDCIASKRVWGTELVRHLGGNVNHGVMYQLIRHINKKIKNQDEGCYEKSHLVFFTILSHFIESKSLLPRLASGGLLTELMTFLNVQTKYRWTCSAALNTLSMFLTSSPEWVSEFADNHGFQLLIDTVNYEVNFALDNPDFAGGSPKDIVTDYKITLRQMNYLRNLLKLFTNLIQSEAGDRLRNLFDSSILLSFNKLIANPDLFGSLVVSATVDSVLYIIHNEPTAFSILKEASVIDTILSNYQDLFMPSLEIILSLLEVLGAICLNKEGLSMVIKADCINKFFKIFYELKLAKVLVQADASTSLGCSLDELGRHFNTLRPLIMAEVKNLVRNFSSFANKELKPVRFYGTGELMFYSHSKDTSVSAQEPQDEIELWESIQGSNLIDNVFSFLSGFLQDSGQWGKECVTDIPFCDWENFLLMENAPYDYVSTNSMINFLSILKYLNDEEKNYGFPHLLNTVKILLGSEELQSFISYRGEGSFFETFTDDNREGNRHLQAIHKVNTVLHGITESFLNPTIMVHERYSSFINYLGSNSDLIGQLVKLLGQCIVEEIKIRSKLPLKVVDITAPSSEAGIDSPLLLVYSECPSKKLPVEHDNSAKFKNTLQLRFLLNYLQFSIVLILACISRSCMQRRQDYFSIEWRRSAAICTRLLAISLSEMWKLKKDIHESYHSNFDLITMNVIYFVAKSKDKGKEVFSTALILYFFITTSVVEMMVDTTIQTLEELASLSSPGDEAKTGEPIKSTVESVKGNFVKQALLFLANLSTPGLIAKLPSSSHFYNRDYCDGDSGVITGIVSQTAVQNLRLVIAYLGSKSRMFMEDDFSAFYKLGPSTSQSLITIARNTWKAEIVDDFYPLKPEWIPPVAEEVEFLKTEAGFTEEEAVEILHELKSLRLLYNALSSPDSVLDKEKWKRCKERLKLSDIEKKFKYEPINTGVSENFKKERENEGSILFTSTMIKLAMSTKHAVHDIYLALKGQQFEQPTLVELYSLIIDLSKNKSGKNLSRLASLVNLFEMLTCYEPLTLLVTETDQRQLVFKKFVVFFIQELEERPDLIDTKYYNSSLHLLELLLSQTVPNILPETKPNYSDIEADENLKLRILKAISGLEPTRNVQSAVSLCRIMYLLAKQSNYRDQIANSRLLQYLTKSMANFLKGELLPFKNLQDIVILVIRVCFESCVVVENIMSTEIVRHMKKGGRRDLKILINDTRHLLARDPEIYVKVMSKKIRLVDDQPDHDAIFLVDDNETALSIAGSSQDVEISSIEQQKTPSNTTGLVHLLLHELMDAYKTDWTSSPNQETEKEEDPKPKKSKDLDFMILLKNPQFAYMCFLLQTLTELLGSSKEAKLEFITFTKKHTAIDNKKPRSTSLNFFIHQMISSQLFVSSSGPEYERRDLLSSLAKITILALVSTTNVDANVVANPKKEDPDMVIVRKFLMDIVSKILKELCQSGSLLSLTYSKLYDLLDMCGCLLSSKFREVCYPLLDKAATKMDPFFIASAFIDIQLPNAIASALACLNLNFPSISRILKVGLKPLANLAKIKVAHAELFESTTVDDEEIDDDIEDRDETPDLFRNSTLGMYDIDLDSEEENDYYDDGPMDVMMSESQTSDDDSDSGITSDTDNDSVADENMIEEELQNQLEGYDSDDSANDIEIIDELAIQSENDSEYDEDADDLSDFYGFDESDPENTRAGNDEEEDEEMQFDDDELDEWLDAFADEDEIAEGSRETSSRFAHTSPNFNDRGYDELLSHSDEDSLTDQQSEYSLDGNETELEDGHEDAARARHFVASFFDTHRISNDNVSNLLHDLLQGRHLLIDIGSNGNDAMLLLNDRNTMAQKSSFDSFIHSTSERWRAAYAYFYRRIENSLVKIMYQRVRLSIYAESMEIFVKKKEERERLKKDREERDRKRMEDLERKREEDERQRQLSIAADENFQREPVMLMIGDREVDISGTDIDPEFFEALPEHMREEVFTEHVRERRSQASNTETEVREIDPDFLDALPEHIREEIMQQESFSRRLSSGGFRYGDDDMDESDEESDIEPGLTPEVPESSLGHDEVKRRKTKNFISPLIDRTGVASLVRLLFVPQSVNHREHIYLTLLQICNNKQTRADIMSLLIAILYDGLSGQKSLERVFEQMSSKAGNLKASHFPLPIGATPVIVGVQMIEAVFYLLEKNSALRLFLLTEHENSFISKKHQRKNRLKDPSTCEERYPINLLLRLLENPLLREENFFIDLLASVLHFGTRPLLILSDKSKIHPSSLDSNFIPDKNLRLIVRILTSNECVNTTFRRTISAMQHLSLLENAQAVFSAELSENATRLGGLIIWDLKNLTGSLAKNKDYENGGKLVNSFTAPSSDQAKLLRILTALDYMFESKKTSDKSTEIAPELDQLTEIYQHLKLGSLWDALSDCLRVLEENQELSKIVTILLPSIEALMVVCKHSKVKDFHIKDAMKYEARKIDFTKEPIESLFFSFTDEHKKILNQMVRANPNLMSGPFSMLVRNPKVLEFDNKKNYFDRQLHEASKTNEKLSISISRDQVFLDSYRALFFKSVEIFRNSILEINFRGEAGVDAGGVTREWYQVLSRQMFNPDYALFTAVASDETTFHPNRTSFINPEHLSFFKFIGRIIGKAIFDNCFLDCHFSRAVYKKILDRPVSLKDMENLDLEYSKSLMWMLENDITDIITEDFSVETDDYGEHKTIDLIPNGRNIPVTEDNKHEYVRLVVEYRLQTSVSEQMSNFIIGFHEIVPKELVAIFDEQELELLISGLPDIDVQDWQNNTTYINYSAASEQIQWFWRAVKSFDNEERAKLLQFATGTSKVPLNGFKELRGANGGCKFSIHRDYGPTDRLPSSHTCFNQIDLPAYELYETLRGSLLLAITEGHEGFGLA